MAKIETDAAGLPELDPQILTDPNQFALWRHIANWSLLRHRSAPGPVLDWIRRQGVQGGKPGGLLAEEETDMILEHDLSLPVPWSPHRCEIDVPDKYDSLVALSDITVPAMAEQGYRVGLISGVFDVLHAGHLLYLKKCREQCDYLVVGVDENELVSLFKGPGRPLNDFAVRVGTLSEVPYVDAVHRVPAAVAHGFNNTFPPYGMPYTTWLYELPDRQQIYTWEQIGRMRPQLEARDPYWFEHIAPNMRFFVGEGDRAVDQKQRAAALMGAQCVVLPRQSQVSSTLLEERFGLVKSPSQPNKFGVPAKWQRGYEKLANW